MNKNFEIKTHEGSSTVHTTKYVFPEKELFVTFNNGATYVYTSVPEATYQEFMESESKGRFFSQNISREFEYTKLELNA